jgi:heme exporter protein B
MFWSLLAHEIKLELRNRQALIGLLVYSLSTIYITYLSYRQTLDPVTWNALFWIIMLFAATNAIARSFLQDSHGLQLYYYTLIDPAVLILARTAHSILLLGFIGSINYLCYSLLFELEIANKTAFLLSLVLGVTGFASTLTLVSSIASKARGNAALVAILGFPLLFPLILTVINASGHSIEHSEWEGIQGSLILLSALNIILIALSYILFPYLWRE